MSGGVRDKVPVELSEGFRESVVNKTIAVNLRICSIACAHSGLLFENSYLIRRAKPCANAKALSGLNDIKINALKGHQQ